MTIVPRLPSQALCSTFENEAGKIWTSLENASLMGLLRDEETITNDLLLNVQMAHPHEVITFQFNKLEEGIVNADWEWWLTNGNKWVGALIQAKKLNSKTHRYNSIKYKDQIGQLIDWAGYKGIVPLYFFYNYTRSSTRRVSWNCGSAPFAQLQLGCTVAHALAVKSMLKQGGVGLSRMSKISLPMRCLVCCPVYSGGDTTLPGRANGVMNALAPQLDEVDPDLRDVRSSQLRDEPPSYVRSLLSVPGEERGVMIEQMKGEFGPIAGLVVVKEPVEK